MVEEWSLREVLASALLLSSLGRVKEVIKGPIIGEDLLLTIKATKQSSTLDDIRLSTNLSESTVMDKSIGLCYREIWEKEKADVHNKVLNQLTSDLLARDEQNQNKGYVLGWSKAHLKLGIESFTPL
ncbi:hypothetical protein AAG906_036876 [Vitis piasezkii]